MKNIWKVVRLLWTQMKQLFLLRIGGVLFASVFPAITLVYLSELIDASIGYVNGTANNQLPFYIGTFVVVQIAYIAIRFINERISIRFNARLHLCVGSESIDKLSRIEYACFESPDELDTINRIGDAPHEKIGRLIAFLTDIVSASSSIIGLMILFSGISTWLMVLLVFMLILIVWLDFKSMNMMNTMFNNQSEDERYLHYYDQLLSNKHTLFELRIYGAVSYIVDKWSARNDKVLSERLKTTLKSKRYFAINTCLLIMWVAVAMIWLGYSAGKGWVGIGLCVSLIGSVPLVMEHSETLSYSLSRYMQNHRIIENYYSFLELPERKDAGKSVDKNRADSIEFRDVSFTYPGTDKEVLHNISTRLTSDQNIAVVGANGAGKSTFIKLICGIYRPTKGKVLLNGTDVHLLSFKEIHRIVSAVFQDFPKYQLSVRENITLGQTDDEAGERDLQNVINALALQDICASGLDRQLGKMDKDGIDVSGGQWQRIALARGISSDTPFLIFDEPTSSLDPIAEDRLYNEFKHIAKTRGCVIISHRLASARLANRIIVFDNGRIIEDGTHAELLKCNGMYAEMYRKQSEWYKA